MANEPLEAFTSVVFGKAQQSFGTPTSYQVAQAAAMPVDHPLVVKSFTIKKIVFVGTSAQYKYSNSTPVRIELLPAIKSTQFAGAWRFWFPSDQVDMVCNPNLELCESHNKSWPKCLAFRGFSKNTFDVSKLFPESANEPGDRSLGLLVMEVSQPGIGKFVPDNARVILKPFTDEHYAYLRDPAPPSAAKPKYALDLAVNGAGRRSASSQAMMLKGQAGKSSPQHTNQPAATPLWLSKPANTSTMGQNAALISTSTYSKRNQSRAVVTQSVAAAAAPKPPLTAAKGPAGFVLPRRIDPPPRTTVPPHQAAAKAPQFSPIGPGSVDEELECPPAKRAKRLARREEEARVLFYYPLDAQFDTVTIRVADYNRCEPGVYMNDRCAKANALANTSPPNNRSVVDFYMKVILREQNVGAEKMHIFSSFLMTRLAKRLMARRPAQTAKERFLAFNEVRRWTRGVDIFGTRCVVVPINWMSHWLLLFVVWLPRQDPDQPPEGQIFILDSLGSPDARFADAIRVYLNHEWEARRRAKASGQPWPTLGFRSKVRVEEEEEEQENEKVSLDSDSDDDVVEIKAPTQPLVIEDPFELSREQEVFAALEFVDIECPRQSDGVNCGLFVMRNVEELAKNFDIVAGAQSLDDVAEGLKSVFSSLRREFRTKDANNMRALLQSKMDAYAEEAKSKKLV